jgi:uncharacterized protein YjbJ (UPF0337 family)
LSFPGQSSFIIPRHDAFGQQTAYADAFNRTRKESFMKNSTKDQVEGKAHELKGIVKEKAGQLKNDPNLEAEGADEKVAGKVQKKIGQIEKVFEQ